MIIGGLFVPCVQNNSRLDREKGKKMQSLIKFLDRHDLAVFAAIFLMMVALAIASFGVQIYARRCDTALSLLGLAAICAAAAIWFREDMIGMAMAERDGVF